MLWQEGVARVLVHALLVRGGRVMPLHRVRVIHDDVLPVGDVHGLAWIRRHAELDHAVGIVQDLEVDVGEEVVPQVWLLASVQELLHLADEAPDGQVIIEHLQELKSCFRRIPLQVPQSGVPRDSPHEGESMWDSASITLGCAQRSLFYFIVFYLQVPRECNGCMLGKPGPCKHMLAWASLFLVTHHALRHTTIPIGLRISAHTPA